MGGGIGRSIRPVWEEVKPFFFLIVSRLQIKASSFDGLGYSFSLSVSDCMAHYTNTLQVQVKFTNYIRTAAIWRQTHAGFVIVNKLTSIINLLYIYSIMTITTVEEVYIAFKSFCAVHRQFMCINSPQWFYKYSETFNANFCTAVIMSDQRNVLLGFSVFMLPQNTLLSNTYHWCS